MKALIVLGLLVVPGAAWAGWCDTQQFEQALHLVPITPCDDRAIEYGVPGVSRPMVDQMRREDKARHRVVDPPPAPVVVPRYKT